VKLSETLGVPDVAIIVARGHCRSDSDTELSDAVSEAQGVRLQAQATAAAQQKRSRDQSSQLEDAA
jgi:hypothetical protein